MTPYGTGIIEGTWNILFCVANPIISEWRPLTFSLPHAFFDLYILLFIALVMMRPQPGAKGETWIACIWLLFAATSIRHLPVFAVLSTPLLAGGLRDAMLRNARPPAAVPAFARTLEASTLRMVNTKTAACFMATLTVMLGAWMFTPQAARYYETQNLNPLPDLSQEIGFLETNYPHARMLNNFNLGGALIFYTRGQIPVFVDGRTEGAYPKSLLRDYMALSRAGQDSQEILERYHIDGIITPLTDTGIIDRFTARRGWHESFAGKTAVIFMRSDP